MIEVCPYCKFIPPEFDGTFYRIEDGDLIFDLSDWDLEETELSLPENYYPKFSKMRNHLSGLKEWDEVHCCPNCQKEFTINCSI